MSAEDSLMELLSCPVCLEYMDKKIYICINGHSFCGGCNSKLVKCPECTVKLNSQRNINLEKVSRRVKKWKSSEEKCETELISQGITSRNRRTLFSLGSPVRASLGDYLTENQIQCPYSKCCYFTKHLLQMKIHLQSWHANNLHRIKTNASVHTDKIIRVRLYWDVNSIHNMFVVTADDTFFVVYVVRASYTTKNVSHIINVLTVSNKTKMFKFTCGNTSKFSMFYQGRYQASDGIEVGHNTVETLNKAGTYKNYIQIYINRVAALHSED